MARFAEESRVAPGNAIPPYSPLRNSSREALTRVMRSAKRLLLSPFKRKLLTLFSGQINYNTEILNLSRF